MDRECTQHWSSTRQNHSQGKLKVLHDTVPCAKAKPKVQPGLDNNLHDTSAIPQFRNMAILCLCNKASCRG